MKFGVQMFQTDFAIRPDDLARELEGRGFESVFFPEHTHIPASRQSPWPGGPDLPKDYWHTHDLFVALATAAAVTKKLRIASGVCLLVERDPITTAKEVASVDFLSNGRMIFGIGGGWNAEEMENHGTEFRTRWKLLRERVEAMKTIWREAEAEYRGELVRFDRIWSYPKPVQKPHPPILLGGNAPQTLRRVVRYADGWMPIAGRGAGSILEMIGELRRLAKAAGRDPSAISVSVFGARPDARVLEGYETAGVERVVLPLPAASPEKVLPILDDYVRAYRLG